jgi:hypothetical protein
MSTAPPPGPKARAMKFAAPIGTPPAVQYFAPDQLQVDPSYQRNTNSRASQALIEAIAQRWDWRLCMPLLVSARAGQHYVIDGQHRWEAAKLRGDIPFLPCAVGQYDGAAAEAALFVAANRHRVVVNRCDMWRAAIAAGDEDTIAVQRLVDGAGLGIAASPQHQSLKPGELLCTKGLIAAFRHHGEAKLKSALGQIGGAFRDQVITYSGIILATVLGFYASPPEPFDAELLQEGLKASSADEWSTHPALVGLNGNPLRSAALRKVILEVMAMIDDEEEAEAA